MKEQQMDIKLRQSEIEKAIKQYLSGQGIALTNKTVSIEFSATRDRAIGTTASIVISDNGDVTIPGYTDRDADPIEDKPKASVTSLKEVTNTAIDAPAPEADPAETETSQPVENVSAGSETAVPSPSGLFAD